MKKADMIAKRDALLSEARAIAETAKTESRALTSEDRDAINGKIAEARSLREDHEAREDLEREAGILSAAAEQPEGDPNIGLTNQEARAFSFVKAIRATATGDWREAGFEREVSEAAGASINGTRNGNLAIPHDVMIAGETRDMTVGTATGDQIVATDLMAGSFIDLLKNKMVLRSSGAQFITGLVGDVAIPKRTTGTTGYWVDENGAPTESQTVLGQVGMSPKTVAGYEDISRKLLQQGTPDIEGLIKNDLASTLAIAIDYAGLHGTGANNQPTGIAATSGIGSVVGGANGANPDWADIVNLETAVAVDNADIGSLSYMVNAATRGYFKRTVRVSSTDSQFIWDRGSTPLNGYATHVSNQVSSTLTKGSTSGTCSAIFFGNWNDLLVGMWGGLDLLVDPFSNSTTGQLRVVAFQSVDIAVRRAESFAAMLDAVLV